ncbi:MAG: hypothetical protein XU13_C0019G0047 [Candidatus Rokubacteria bacterium CSP1-6]|nr:MAG: hypothetical protein XU13_C0019G0047 [Candidatus Rokubacteria bacterium CSP1-6]
MPTRGAFFLLLLLLGSTFGCGTGDERRWQKMGVEYTTVEFNRDVDACTRNKKLDDECMKARGWVPMNPDRPAPTPSPTPSRTRGY